MSTQSLNYSASKLQAAATRFQGLLKSEPGRAPRPGIPKLRPCAVYIDSGIHTGARIRVNQSPIRLGSAAENDIVLRDAGVMPHHAELRWVNGAWSLFVADGAHAFPPLQTQTHGAFVRQRHGIGASSLIVSQLFEKPSAPVKAPLQWQRIVAPVLFVSAGLLGAGVFLQFIKPARATLSSVQSKTLATEGWPDVQVKVDEQRGVQVTGYVNDAKALTNLKQWLKTSNLPQPEMTVRVGEELATRVREALGDPGLKVTYLAGGKVRLQGSSEDLNLVTQVQRLRADLAGVVQIEDLVVHTEAAKQPVQRPLPLRIVSVNPGPNGSFTTDTGARFFVGAVLSDGAEVSAILSDGVAFKMGEKNVIYPLN